MEFLKDALGDDFDLFKEKIDAYNLEHPENTLTPVNLDSGEYVTAGEVRRIKTDSAVDVRLISSGAKNASLVKKLLDFDKISLSGSTLEGFDEQIATLKSENPYLFSDGKSATGMRQGSTKPTYPGFMRTILDNQARRK